LPARKLITAHELNLEHGHLQGVCAPGFLEKTRNKKRWENTKYLYKQLKIFEK
jgi:hypothetical protein